MTRVAAGPASAPLLPQRRGELPPSVIPGVPIAVRRAGTLSTAESEELRALVDVVGSEFVPPLAHRTSTTQARFGSLPDDTAGAYMTALLAQHTLLAREAHGALVGFVSFQAPRLHPAFPAEGPVVYLSTVAVLRAHRREGHAARLYETLFALPETATVSVLLRTWSTNARHLALLETLGFTELTREADARGPGVDTVYLARRPS